MFSGNFGVPTAAEIQIDREIEEVKAAFAAGREISQIEPWNQRLSRCCPAVQRLLEIGSLLAVDDEESEESEEFDGAVRGFCSEEQKELRMRRYEEMAASGKEIQFVPSTEVL